MLNRCSFWIIPQESLPTHQSRIHEWTKVSLFTQPYKVASKIGVKEIIEWIKIGKTISLIKQNTIPFHPPRKRKCRCRSEPCLLTSSKHSCFCGFSLFLAHSLGSVSPSFYFKFDFLPRNRAVNSSSESHFWQNPKYSRIRTLLPWNWKIYSCISWQFTQICHRSCSQFS